MNELKLCIIEKFGTEAEMARTMGWTRQRLNKITNGKKEPDVSEVAEIAQALGKSITQVAEFFLAEKSPNGQQNEPRAPERAS